VFTAILLPVNILKSHFSEAVISHNFFCMQKAAVFKKSRQKQVILTLNFPLRGHR
jgi:hypothetical protein